eukprot:3462690-Amphidinium_carterae.3
MQELCKMELGARCCRERSVCPSAVEWLESTSFVAPPLLLPSHLPLHDAHLRWAIHVMGRHLALAGRKATVFSLFWVRCGALHHLAKLQLLHTHGDPLVILPQGVYSSSSLLLIRNCIDTIVTSGVSRRGNGISCSKPSASSIPTRSHIPTMLHSAARPPVGWFWDLLGRRGSVDVSPCVTSTATWSIARLICASAHIANRIRLGSMCGLFYFSRMAQCAYMGLSVRMR